MNPIDISDVARDFGLFVAMAVAGPRLQSPIRRRSGTMPGTITTVEMVCPDAR